MKAANPPPGLTLGQRLARYFRSRSQSHFSNPPWAKTTN